MPSTQFEQRLGLTSPHSSSQSLTHLKKFLNKFQQGVGRWSRMGKIWSTQFLNAPLSHADRRPLPLSKTPLPYPLPQLTVHLWGRISPQREMEMTLNVHFVKTVIQSQLLLYIHTFPRGINLPTTNHSPTPPMPKPQINFSALLCQELSFSQKMQI